MSGGLWRRANTRVCPRWFIGAFDNPIRRIAHDPAAICAGLVGEGQVVVDVGCGIGFFTIPLATMVGPAGRVIAVDLQQSMLEGVRRRAVAAGVADRILLHRAAPGDLGVSGPADLVLAFWMVHEVPEKLPFFRQVRGLLSPAGTFLMVEPRVHVSGGAFGQTLEEAASAGLEPAGYPRVSLSRAVLFRVSPLAGARPETRP